MSFPASPFSLDKFLDRLIAGDQASGLPFSAQIELIEAQTELAAARARHVAGQHALRADIDYRRVIGSLVK